MSLRSHSFSTSRDIASTSPRPRSESGSGSNSHSLLLPPGSRLWVWAAAQLLLVTILTTGSQFGGILLPGELHKAVEHAQHQLARSQKRLQNSLDEVNREKSRLLKEHSDKVDSIRIERSHLEKEIRNDLKFLKNDWLQLKVQNRQLLEQLKIEENQLTEWTIKDESIKAITPLSKEKRDALYKTYTNIEQEWLSVIPQKIPHSTCHHTNRTQPDRSTIEFVGKDGLGHKLIHMSAAAHLAQRMEASLYGYWQCCDRVDVFKYLFGTEEIDYANHNKIEKALKEGASDIAQVIDGQASDEYYHMQFRYHMPGFRNFRKLDSKDRCNIDESFKSKIESDNYFYQTLLYRYHLKSRVQNYVDKHFAGRHVIGVHISEGLDDYEDGKFKKRGRRDRISYIEKVAKHIKDIAASPEYATRKSIVFIATDNDAYIEGLKSALLGTMAVFDMPQYRAAIGEGALFGEHWSKGVQDERCLETWDGAVQDLLLLSQVNTLLAATPNSLTQSMPMNMVLQSRNEKNNNQYCELNGGSGENLRCYTSVGDWHCKDAADVSVNDFYLDIDPAFSTELVVGNSGATTEIKAEA